MECLDDKPNENAPNQVTDDNKIEVYGGSKQVGSSSSNMQQFAIEKALVKYDDNAEIGTYYDISVLISQEPFYSDGQINIGPICLGASGILKAVESERKTITSVGWGQRYSEYPVFDDILKRNPTHTSCTTNEMGPILHRFKPCHVPSFKDNGWKCNKAITTADKLKYHGNPYDFKRCRNHLIAASKMVNEKTQEIRDRYRTVIKKLRCVW